MRGGTMWLALGLAASLMIPAASAEEDYSLAFEDDAGDEEPHCAPSTTPDLENPCDILLFEAGHDDENLYLRVTLATTTWPNAAQGVNVRAIFTDPAGKQYLTGVILDGEGGGQASTFGSNVHPDGVAWSVDAESDTVTATVPLASLGGIEAGAEVTLDDAVTRMGQRQAGQYLTAFMDTVPGLTPLTLALEAASAGPAVHYDELEGPELRHAFSNATSDTYVLNFTNGFENATASLAWNATGSVDVALNGPDGVRFTETLEGEGAVEQAFTGVPTGAWNLTLAYQDFVGDLRFSLTEGVGDDETPADETDEADDEGQAEGNETLQGGAAGEESPAWSIVAFLAVVAAIAYRRR